MLVPGASRFGGDQRSANKDSASWRTAAKADAGVAL